jgi:hypothetical protein
MSKSNKYRTEGFTSRYSRDKNRDPNPGIEDSRDVVSDIRASFGLKHDTKSVRAKNQSQATKNGPESVSSKASSIKDKYRTKKRRNIDYTQIKGIADYMAKS